MKFKFAPDGPIERQATKYGVFPLRRTLMVSCCVCWEWGVPFVSLERQFANESFALENVVKHLTNRILPSCSFACKVIFALFIPAMPLVLWLLCIWFMTLVMFPQK